MLDLNDLKYFVHVVDFHGFTAASGELGIPKSRLSRRVSALEEALQVKLLHRSSRQFSVTDIGASLYEHAKAMLIEAQAAESAVGQRLSEPSGTVKLSCSHGIAEFALGGLLPRFLEENPKVTLVQDVGNHYVDPIAEGFDLVIRAHDQPLPDSELIQKRLAQVCWGLFAAPQYLANRDQPQSPEELEAHPRLLTGNDPDKRWTLQHEHLPDVIIQNRARYVSGSMMQLKYAAKKGLGVVALPTYVCADCVIEKSLIRILPEWSVGRPYISLITTSRRGQLPAVKALVEALEQWFERIDEREDSQSISTTRV
ncbi:LysR substrate-binding domain-containing protein [Marinimicrobium agarilyticum]|uniref:LysR substrate-binding domain-containing protein n=1 Tax=Marinimicrobium agarilyticum TaxID=306546 RepID=UPI00040BF43F|nr:LysR substrate-binding domain-containing protein [Marinimicrobium agarilyticum]